MLIVSDVNDPEVPEHLKVTEEVIEELGAAAKPKIYVYNKCDLAEITDFADYTKEDTVFISARTGAGIDKLFDLIKQELDKLKKQYRLLIPYDKQSLINDIYKSFVVLEIEYGNEGVAVDVILDERGKGIYKSYIVEG